MVIPVCLQVSKQSLLAQGSRLWQPVVRLVHRTIHALFVDERLEVEEGDHVGRDEACLDADVLGVR